MNKQNQPTNQKKNKWGLGFLLNFIPGSKNKPQQQKKKRVCKKFQKSQFREFQSTWISSIHLGFWDNTMGPRIEVVWKGLEM